MSPLTSLPIHLPPSLPPSPQGGPFHRTYPAKGVTDTISFHEQHQAPLESPLTSLPLNMASTLQPSL